MRWNRQERIVGGCVIGAALVVGFVLPPWGTAVIRSGMTLEEVETLFVSEGSNCDIGYYCCIWRSPGQSEEEFRKAADKFYREHLKWGRRYESWGGTVVVKYRRPDGQNRVVEVEGRRRLSLGLLGHLLPWTIIGYGLSWAIIACRRRRLATSPAVAA